MPQMSPMNWFFLFIYFNFSFYLALSKLHFFSKMYTTKKELKFYCSTYFEYKV